MRIAAVSVDLDEIPNYHAIHGLTPGGAAATAVYDVAIDRLEHLASSCGVPLTLFAIGADLARPAAASRLRRAKDRGAEVANHTANHRYDFSRLPDAELAAEIEGGADAIARATGARPTGFRAPGYTVNDRVFRALERAGYAYDSSVFPCPAYYSAKTAKLAAIALRGRTSRSILDDPRILLAPTRPYRVGTPYRTRGDGMLELPIQVTRGPRLPFIGTTVTLLGAARARWLARACVGEPLVNLELHGIDVLDRRDSLEDLAPHQPDVRVDVDAKLDALSAVIDTLKKAGYAFLTLAEAAEACRPHA